MNVQAQVGKNRQPPIPSLCIHRRRREYSILLRFDFLVIWAERHSVAVVSLEHFSVRFRIGFVLCYFDSVYCLLSLLLSPPSTLTTLKNKFNSLEPIFLHQRRPAITVRRRAICVHVFAYNRITNVSKNALQISLPCCRACVQLTHSHSQSTTTE